jgi:hypothetical protein
LPLDVGDLIVVERTPLVGFRPEADVFGAEAYADEAGWDAAKVGDALEEFEEPGEG